MKPSVRIFACTLALAAAAVSAQEHSAPPASIAAPQAVSGNDPYEPYNRVMFQVNDTADRYLLSPLARGYRKVTPRPVRMSVSNFFNNLRDAVSFGSNVLRLDIKRASEDFMRVAVNTTFGLGGLINIADAGGMPDNKNSLGDTFASWGWQNSHYFVYPLTGPSTVRDSIGSTLLLAYPPQSAVFKTTSGRVAAAAANAVSTRENLLDLTDSLDEAALDKYAYTRDMYLRLRAQQLGQAVPTGADEEIDIDDLVGGDGADTADEAARPSESAASEAADGLTAESSVRPSE
ncbi:VacJ family lipoprotein [Neisseria leonii]|uniref:VacJ family lipoprotein n=1 Tax=Neisseria leonii TaxID=2995413 RepID=A0A9X4E6H3_9NEIS|nr:VacJ family lipoprotein [Neisseria sp. 51.81]MDD9328711.1 VacJ family lipoprotein [Neisseria sp. 51.81]